MSIFLLVSDASGMLSLEARSQTDSLWMPPPPSPPAAPQYSGGSAKSAKSHFASVFTVLSIKESNRFYLHICFYFLVLLFEIESLYVALAVQELTM